MIYTSTDGKISLEAQLKDETIWLSQKQMAELFEKGRSTVAEHILNAFKEQELNENSVCREFRRTGADGKEYAVRHYNLDVIISVGYRVKSLRGTQFRIWATKILRDHIVKGFTINKKRLNATSGTQLKELQSAVALFQKTLHRHELKQPEAVGLLQVITEYAQSWILLQQFDEGTLTRPQFSQASISIEYAAIKEHISLFKAELMKKKEASELFGNERESALRGILGNVNQSFGGKAVYPSVEEKAAHLLYFVIKDHPFTDGNKRIGSLIFILFLRNNKKLLKKNGEKKINDNALVALALLIAESDHKEKESMVRLIINFLKG